MRDQQHVPRWAKVSASPRLKPCSLARLWQPASAALAWPRLAGGISSVMTQHRAMTCTYTQQQALGNICIVDMFKEDEFVQNHIRSVTARAPARTPLVPYSRSRIPPAQGASLRRSPRGSPAAARGRLSDAHLTLADDVFVVRFGGCRDLIQG